MLHKRNKKLRQQIEVGKCTNLKLLEDHIDVNYYVLQDGEAQLAKLMRGTDEAVIR